MGNIYASLAVFGVCLITALHGAGSADAWAAPTDLGVVSINHCGRVSAVRGAPVVRRSYMTAKDSPLPLSELDRLDAGDEVDVPEGSALEIIAGDNSLLLIGADSIALLSGMRQFSDASGRAITRLDLKLSRGAARFQVRLNESKPEMVKVNFGRGELLLSRGDVWVAAGDAWKAAVLSGGAFCRLYQGGLLGSPFEMSEGNAVTAKGLEALDPKEGDSAWGRLRFSYERRRAELPPLPPPNPDSDAP